MRWLSWMAVDISSGWKLPLAGGICIDIRSNPPPELACWA